MAQDAFVKIYTKLPEFRGQAAFTTWLHRIVSNLSIDRLRKTKRHGEVEYDDARTHGVSDSASGPTLASVYLDGPGRALERSGCEPRWGAPCRPSRPHREVLLMREIDGLSYEELAGALQVAKGTVMSRLFHARKKFMAAMSGYLHAR